MNWSKENLILLSRWYNIFNVNVFEDEIMIKDYRFLNFILMINIWLRNDWLIIDDLFRNWLRHDIERWYLKNVINAVNSFND